MFACSRDGNTRACILYFFFISPYANRFARYPRDPIESQVWINQQSTRVFRDRCRSSLVRHCRSLINEKNGPSSSVQDVASSFLSLPLLLLIIHGKNKISLSLFSLFRNFLLASNRFFFFEDRSLHAGTLLLLEPWRIFGNEFREGEKLLVSGEFDIGYRFAPRFFFFSFPRIEDSFKNQPR